MLKLKKLNLEDCVFISTQTVNVSKSLEIGTQLYTSWEYKMKYNKDSVESGETSYEEMYNNQASLYPEFGKIVVISIGKIKEGSLKIKSFIAEDEKSLLKEFNSTMATIIANNKNTCLIGHSIQIFDVPFILKRSIINGIEPSNIIDINHLKPWNYENTIIDIQNLWQGGSITKASLLNIATCFEIEVGTINGNEANNIYYNNKNGLDILKINCEKNILSVANIVRKCRFEDTVSAEIAELKEKPVGIMQKAFNTKTLTKEDEKKIVKTLETLTEKEKTIADEILEIVTK